MKIKSLLSKAKRCSSQEDAAQLLDLLKDKINKHPLLSHLWIYNAESMMEVDTPFVSFELNRVYSDEYVLMIRPEIRDEAFTIQVTMYHMQDKLGVCSKKANPLVEMNEVLEPSKEQNLEEVCVQAVKIAINYHRMLMVSVGVPNSIANTTADSCWK
ncbi:hypothetical protein [Undibacterium oligocarboniphilum]|uniref:Uncharacterized protein n=1 Tax=Undibacterium oligocarboniphilum TaxID=666702 RepID=A0A850QEN6_9BURK|nr:hypothetical protein [Undibacterium oligocarboniphilum]MBC3871492.1 hypothetical protein [Undibacterium oligocarboniphilum]NVO78932.1 hypothetical protein [Undibacterium oligocarboniphilum]